MPAEIYQRGLAERDDLKPLTPEQAYLFSRDCRTNVSTKSHALARFTRPDGTRGGFWFHSLGLMKEEGIKVAIYHDSQNPEAGATVMPIRPRRAGEAELPRYFCEYVDGTPQFAMDTDELNPAMIAAYARKKGAMDAVRTEYRALGFGQRIARRSSVKDGAGSEAAVNQIRNSPHNDGRGRRPTSMPSNGEQPEQTGFCADRERNRKSARTAQPTFDADRLARLEAQFLEDNPALGIT